MEDLINSLLKSLESASGRSIGMVMAVIGALIWWGVHLIRKIGRKMRNDVSVSENPSGVQRPRKRLSLREYHR
ncbi:MAG: hypothetical protein OXI94_15360 [Gemmatimonadota bacterium]|nr:hypothetical protein [Gemmatimonadota bacterium]MDE2832007.1 hypothetical protein [Gemmatimonadota bacterium]